MCCYRWWPLALIFLGLIKLYERTVASRSDDPGSARITGGEILLVVGMLVLLSCVVAVDYWQTHHRRQASH